MSETLGLLPRLAAFAFIAALLAVAPAALAQESTEAETQEEEGGFFDDLKEYGVDLKEKAAAQVPDVPSGAVIAFNREECPLGWSEFPPTVGRVVVGIGDAEGGRSVSLMQIGEPDKAAAPTGGVTVAAGQPWLGLLYCEKD